MPKDYKRVLVLSHNAFSKTQNNGKTLESFFQNWDKDSIAQIFLQPEIPDFDFCNRYFRMTDYEVLNNIVFKGEIGEEITDYINDIKYTERMNPIIRKLYTDRRKGSDRKGLNRIIHNAFVERIPLFISIREIFWHMANWKSASLIKWIKEFSPDVLFFQGSSCVFGYEIALWICNEFSIPMILELTDDYTTCLYRWSIIEKINKRSYRRIFKEAIKYAHKVIAISEYMMHEYKEQFGGEYTVLMNSINRNINTNEPQGIRLLYAGNVSINRWVVLLKIGKALDEIKSIYNLNCRLDIYTPVNISGKIKTKLTSISSIEYGGSLSQEELNEEITKSNILVHVESFNNKAKRITRLSISTKIPEYMASNRCIFAVGPKDVASIKYLRDNNFAKVVDCDDISKIRDSLVEIIKNHTLRKNYCEKAYEAYNLNHHPRITQKSILEIIENICTKES